MNESPDYDRARSEYTPEFFLWHSGGPWLRATFATANDAFVWQEGNKGRPYADRFYITDGEGKKVTFDEPARHPGHAYAILDKLGESR